MKNKNLNIFKKNKKIFLFQYFVLFIQIAIIPLCFYFFFYSQLSNANQATQPLVVKVFLFINFIFLSLIYCDGIKNIIFILVYYLFYSKKQRKPNLKNINDNYSSKKLLFNNHNKKVLLIYTTKDDFDENSLLCSMNQNYDNFEVFILDDSKDENYIKKIKNFVNKFTNGVHHIRRNNNIGFKAGNLNSFLKKFTDYDYFVLLDSDEIICKDFINECLRIFDNDESIGIVQANHTSNRWNNLFEKSGCLGIFPGASTSLTMKNIYGVPTLYGHGAMIKKECYVKTGGFPEIVSEDVGFVIKSLEQGFRVEFANNLICDEKFPVDYVSFKKRSIKWIQGNFELFKKMRKDIIKLKIPFYRKITLL